MPGGSITFPQTFDRQILEKSKAEDFKGTLAHDYGYNFTKKTFKKEEPIYNNYTSNKNVIPPASIGSVYNK